MILLIDNYDSFTYNVYHLFRGLKADVAVVRNDAVTCDEIMRLSPSAIIIFPGPGRPEDAGVSEDAVRMFYSHIPILGICLGHQAIADVFSSPVVHAPSVVHGKPSKIIHCDDELFEGIPREFNAARYHSLVVDRSKIDDRLSIIAETEDKIVMAIKLKGYPVYGIQFHPESILTEYGRKLARNFLSLTGGLT